MIRGLLNAITGNAPAPKERATPAPVKAEPPASNITQVTAATVTHGVKLRDPNAPVFHGQPVPAYPDLGIAAPAVPPEMLMDSQRDKIDRLHQVSSFSRQDFDRLILPVIRLYAEYVHLLPASESQHHCGQGGLFRHGLEVAYNAALACESKVFAYDHWASDRDKLVPRWRMCAILGGMIHDMGKPIIDVGAIDATGKLSWNPHAGSLYAWLVEHQLEQYYIHWRVGARHKRHEAFNSMALYRIVPDETMRWITDFGGKEPLDALVMALSGSSDPNNPLASLIKQADSKSVSKDIQESRTRLAASGLGGVRSLAVRLIRAMHDLIQDGTWEPNKIGSPIWITTEGVMGITPAIQKGALEVLREQGDTSLPQDYNDVLALLADWGYLHVNTLSNGLQYNTWRVQIQTEDRGKPVSFNSHVVRFSKEDLLPRALITPAPIKVTIFSAESDKPVFGVPVDDVPASPTPATAPVPSPADAPSQDDPTPIPAAPDAPTVVDAQGKAVDTELLPPIEPMAPTEDSAALLLGDSPAEGLLYIEGEAGDTSQAPVDLLKMDEPAPLRDRANELDPRIEKMNEARKQIDKKWPPPTPEAAMAYFGTQGYEGKLITAVCARVNGNELVEGQHLWEIGHNIHLRFPDALSGLGLDEAEVRDVLERKGWIDRDSQRNRSTFSVHVGERKPAVTVRLSENITQAVRLLLPARNLNSVDGKPQGNSQRVLALGPFLDEAIARGIQAAGPFKKEDAFLIRPGFHQFVLSKLNDRGIEIDELESKDIDELILDFVRCHRIHSKVTDKKNVREYLIHSPNEWALPTTTNRSGPLTFNREYRMDLDLAEQAKRGVK